MASFEQRPTGSIIASLSWQSLLSAIGAMPKLFISAMAAWMIIEAGLFLVPGAADIVIHPGRGWAEEKNLDLYLLVRIGQTILCAAVFAPVAVAMHRFILLNRVTPGVISLGPYHTRLFFVWLAALQLILGAVDESINSRASSFVQLVCGLAMCVAVVVLSIHLAMIFPAVATDVPSESWSARIAKSWRQMRGHSWLFFRAGILVTVPVLLAGAIFLVAYFILDEAYRAGHGDELFHFPPLYRVLLTAMLQPLGVALTAATASWMYAWASQSQSEAPLPQAV